LGLWPLIGCLPWPLLRPELRPSKSTEVCFALTKGSSTGRRSSSKSSSSKGISGSSSGSRSSSSSSGHVSDSFFGGGGLYTARGKERRAHSHRLQQPQPTGAVHPGLMGRAAASVEAKAAVQILFLVEGAFVWLLCTTRARWICALVDPRAPHGGDKFSAAGSTAETDGLRCWAASSR
jgi:hypothetical protein